MSNSPAALQTDSLSFSYGEISILQDVSLTVERGSLVAVLGPNGSGKTTLLRLLGGLLRPITGRVLLENNDLTALSPTTLARRMAVVPQETHLAFDYSVLEITLMGRYPHMGPFQFEGPADFKIAREALTATGTSHLERRGYTTLSGGEKQRVIIASALAQIWQISSDEEMGTNNGILLLDEPTASLDLGYQLDITDTLRSLNQDCGTTMVVSTHDLNLAARLCENLIMLHEGQILAAGPPEQVLNTTTIRALYGVEAEVHRHNKTGHLTIVPVAKR